MPQIRVNQGLLTALCERWHSETSSFHLPTGEATVTLEDVYRILRLPIRGTRVAYDTQRGATKMCRYYPHVDIRQLEFDDYEIRWWVLAQRYKQLDCLLATLIGGIVLLDLRGHGFLVGWGEMLAGML